MARAVSSSPATWGHVTVTSPSACALVLPPAPPPPPWSRCCPAGGWRPPPSCPAGGTSARSAAGTWAGEVQEAGAGDRCRRQVQVHLTWCRGPAACARCIRGRAAGCPWRPGAAAPGWAHSPPRARPASPPGPGWRPLAALHLAGWPPPCSVSTSWPPSWPPAAWRPGGRTCNITQLILVSA